MIVTRNVRSEPTIIEHRSRTLAPMTHAERDPLRRVRKRKGPTMAKIPLVMIALVPLVLTACSNLGGPKQIGGTLLGGGLGALAGSQFGGGTGRLAAVAVGTLLGAFVGSEAGKSLDRADKLFANRTAQRSLERVPSGQSTTWRNPDNGHSGTFTPTRTFQTTSGGYCREYQQTVTVAGETQRAFGKACRQPDGSWRITS